MDEVPYEVFPEEFVCWVHEVAAGGLKHLSDDCFEAHRELLRCLLLVGAKVFPIGVVRDLAAVRFYSAVLAWDALVTGLRLVVLPLLHSDCGMCADCAFSTLNPEDPKIVGIASRRSGVARRRKRHRSKGGGRNAVGSNAIATAMARGSWQRRLGILL